MAEQDVSQLQCRGLVDRGERTKEPSRLHPPPCSFVVGIGLAPSLPCGKEKLNRSGDNQDPLHRQTPLDLVGSQVILKFTNPPHPGHRTSTTGAPRPQRPVFSPGSTSGRRYHYSLHCTGPSVPRIPPLRQTLSSPSVQKCPDTDIEDSVAWGSHFASCNIFVAFDIDFNWVFWL